MKLTVGKRVPELVSLGQLKIWSEHVLLIYYLSIFTHSFQQQPEQ